MKKIYAIIAMLCIVLGSWAQSSNQVVHLKNGSAIKGVILEQIPNESIKVKTSDGSIFVYRMEEVSHINADENNKTGYTEGRHRGLDFNIHAGYIFGVGDSKGAGLIPVEVGLGKQVNSNLYIGGVTGAWIPTEGNPIIPIGLQARLQATPGKSSVVPNIGVGLTYGINTESGDYAQDLFAFQLMPGLTMPLSETTSFMLSAGYMHTFNLGKIGGSGNFIALKAGFNFNKHPIKKPKKHKEPKPKKPVRTNGAIYNIEIGFPSETFSFGYRFNRYFSASVGVGYMRLIEQHATVQRIDENTEYINTESASVAPSGLTAFLRGTYRPVKRRFSPIISCDLGILFGDDQINDPEYDIHCGNILYVKPSVGFSWRTSANSYLELKVGYTMTGKVSHDKIYDGSDYWYSYKPVNVSTPSIQIGFKRNLKWLSK